MPGTLVKDAIAPVLYDGTAITTATTTTGSAVVVDKPGDVRVQCALGTLTGSATTCNIEIQGSETSAFTAYVAYGRFGVIGPSDDNKTLYIDADVYSKYLRAVIITAGSSPSYTPTITVVAPDFHRVATDSASPTAA